MTNVTNVLMSYVRDKKHSSMFRVRWPNGDVSTDYYNEPRAKEFLTLDGIEDFERHTTHRMPLYAPRELTDAFK